MPVDDKKGSRLIARAVKALRQSGLSADYSASGFDSQGPFIIVRDSPKARKVLQPVRQSGLRVEWGEAWFDSGGSYSRPGET